MKTLKSQRVIKVPDGVTVSIKSRTVTVTGPRGELTRSFKHQSLDMVPSKDQVTVTKWFGKRKELACIRTISAHIENMITGVTKGFRYKMRLGYAHFPINVTIIGKQGVDHKVEIRAIMRGIYKESVLYGTKPYLFNGMVKTVFKFYRVGVPSFVEMAP